MGMFDYLTCKYPLPVEGANALEFQSKDTPAQWMDWYEIREDGSLWAEEYDIEDRSDPNAESGSLESIRGMMTRVNKRWRPEKYTGEICFGSSWTDRYGEPGHDPGRIEFSAYFVDGQIQQLHVIENRPATDAALHDHGETT